MPKWMIGTVAVSPRNVPGEPWRFPVDHHEVEVECEKKEAGAIAVVTLADGTKIKGKIEQYITSPSERMVIQED